MPGGQQFWETDCHILLQSGIRPDLRVRYFLAFAWHPFYWCVTFTVPPLYCSYLVPQTGVGRVHILIYSSLKPLNIFCFVFLFLFLHYFRFFVPFHPIAFIFPPAYCGTSGLSLHLLILPVTGGRYDLFQNCWVFLGSHFWSSVGLFWTHLLISGFMNVARSIVYLSVRYLLETCLKRNLFP